MKKGNYNSTKNLNKRLRMMGKKYKGLKRISEKYEFCVDRAERSLTPSKCSKRCGKSRVIHCPQISEDDRQSIFSKFWDNMDWDQRKVYVNSLVIKEISKRQMGEDNTSRKKYSYRYMLWKNNEKIPVCKNMFLSTLGIGEQTAYGWLMDARGGIPKPSTGTEHNELREKEMMAMSK